MSTRSFIGFYNSETGKTEGVYHHSDGYPSGVGNTCYHLAQIYDNTQLDLFSNGLHVLRDLLFEHPSGFSYLLAWSGAPEDMVGYNRAEAARNILRENYGSNYYDQYYNLGLGVYYDGQRADPNAVLMNLSEAYHNWCEYAYVIFPEYRLMVVYKVGNSILTKLGIVDFDAPMPKFLED